MTDRFQLFIDGAWVDASNGVTFANHDPANHQHLGDFAAGTSEDADRAVSAAKRAFATWSQTPLHERQAIVERFLQLLAEERDALAEIISRENGKTLNESRAEIDSAIVEGRHHLFQSSVFTGQAAPGRQGDSLVYERYVPVGVVAVISPWNYPANVMCRKTLPALLTGNAVVFKPASFTPWSAVGMAQLFERAGVPAGVFNLVSGGGRSVGGALLDDPRVRAVTFTGSTAVGKRIQAQVAPHLTRTQLELGGKNATVVMDDADLDAVRDAVRAAAFGCSGQWCTSTSRLLVHEAIAERVETLIAELATSLRVGDPLAADTDMGPVAGEEQFENISAAIQAGIDSGARLLAGGMPASKEQGYFIAPTVFADVGPDMSLFRDEIFGPVLSITRFRDLDEAINLCNDSDYGLSSSIYTTRLSDALHFSEAVHSGMTHVNIHSGYKEPLLPFGGWGESGAGLPENGRCGLEFFVERKAVYLRAPATEAGR